MSNPIHTPPPSKIILDAYWTETDDENRPIVFDKEMMHEQLEDKLLKLEKELSES